MLKKCPECDLPVSDKAVSCPHCGYPMHNRIGQHISRKSSRRRKRLPNGFGQISEIKNRNLRNPFRAMVTVGKTSEGKPICKLLKPESYFPTYNDAYAALVEYNRNPYDLNNAMTAHELYEKWFAEYIKTQKSEKSIKAIALAWRYCSSIYNMRVADIRARHIKGCMEQGTANIKGVEKHPNAATKTKIKSLFNMMLDYAVEYELIDKNYARTFHLSNETIKELHKIKKEHLTFSDEEILLLWEHVNDKQFADIVLIQCYSGWRPQELGLIELSNVDLENRMITGGIKTEAGINRTVPIHHKIQPLVEARYCEANRIGSKYLFNCTNPGKHTNSTQLTYARYLLGFTRLCDELHLNPDHRPHDGRKHFVTMAKKYGVDEYAIKYIVGHAIYDITEKTYTKRELSWLSDEIEKIK